MVKRKEMKNKKNEVIGNRQIHKLLEKLKVNNEGDTEIILDVLSKMPKEQLDTLYNFLYPEEFTANQDVNKLIEMLKEKGKKYFRVERKGNEVTIEIP